MPVGCIKTFFPRLHNILVQIQIRSRSMKASVLFDTSNICCQNLYYSALGGKNTSQRYDRAESRNVFYGRTFSTKECLSKIVFHQKLSSIKDCPPSKIVSIQKCLSSKFIFPSRVGRLPSKVVFHKRLSFIKGCL